VAEVEQPTLDKIERRFAELRDELLAASHEFAKSEHHDWEQAERLFVASKKVDELCRSVLTRISEQPTEGSEASQSGVNGAGMRPSSGPKSRKKSKKDYPQYKVRSDALIKIGLSRNRRDVYEHTVPRGEFDAVVQRLGELSGRKHFSADEVITKVSSPSYQAYIVISLLKDRGVLTAPRRGIYAFRHPKDFLHEARALWESLEQHQTENAK
jgi:hypothetical protein